MTIWILHQPLNAEEEAHIGERTHLPLPLNGMPDLSVTGGPAGCRHLLQALYPDDPPETITRKLDSVWRIYGGVHKEDIIAVPLTHSGKVMLAEVTGGYQYHVDGAGDDVHLMPVKWYPGPISMRRFGKHKEMFVKKNNDMHEVGSAGGRIAIRDQLPHSYNRFAKWKWLLVLFFLMHIAGMLQHLLHGHRW